MKRVDQIITKVRRRTDNEDYSDTEGLAQDEFAEFIDEAQADLQATILSEIPNCSLFDTSVDVDLVASQRAYDLATSSYRPFGGNMVRMVEFKPTASSQDYYPLQLASLFELAVTNLNYPSAYDIRDGQVLLSPVPSSAIGNLRITYPRELDRLDIRRAQVTSATIVTTSYTTITLEADPVPDSILEDEDYYICINDAYGNVVYYNIPVVSFDSSTRVLTLDTGVLTANGSISAGDWVTFDKYSTTTSKLPDNCERYLIAYGIWKGLKRDSSVDSSEQQQELVAIKQSIIEALKTTYRDVPYIPMLNTFYQV